MVTYCIIVHQHCLRHKNIHVDIMHATFLLPVNIVPWLDFEGRTCKYGRGKIAMTNPPILY